MTFCCLVISIVSSGCAVAMDRRGQAIAEIADSKQRGYMESVADLEMILISQSGETASRNLRIFSRENDGENDKTLMIFDAPRDLRGTGVLSWNHASGDDEQWIYLPTLKRVKQIGARNKSGPFMGSEFAYEDIVTSFWQKFTYQLIREEVLAGTPCFVIERKPKDKYSGYTRQLIWIDGKDYMIRKIEYFDRKNSLLKTYVATGFSKMDGKHWRSSDMHMTNHQTGKQTKLHWKNYRFGAGISKEDFTMNSLMRVR